MSGGLTASQVWQPSWIAGLLLAVSRYLRTTPTRAMTVPDPVDVLVVCGPDR
jgi:hypothetical protein